MTALAVIPARAGSKRVPGKNVRMLCGKPAIAYTIEAARESRVFDRIVVSTDGEAIADVARRCGADVPFVRSSTLADDQTPVSAVTVDALERIDPAGERFDVVAQLMPNAPLRDAADVDASFRQFITTQAQAQISVSQYGWQPAWWAMQRSSDFRLLPLFPAEVLKRSQDLPQLFCPTGAIWWAQADVLRSTRTFHVDGRTGWEIDPSHAVDIDTEDDWRLAEALMQLRVGSMDHAG
jgi:CMP-N-acetylneuraminic acid synthetase